MAKAALAPAERGEAMIAFREPHDVFVLTFARTPFSPLRYSPLAVVRRRHPGLAAVRVPRAEGNVGSSGGSLRSGRDATHKSAKSLNTQ